VDDLRRTSLVGRTLAHYRISAVIGAGGMGEVYRATDTKLAREVALTWRASFAVASKRILAPASRRVPKP
jgi:serine/threonine protein kinase